MDAILVLIPLNYFYRKKLLPIKELGLEKPKAKPLVKNTLVLFASMALVSVLVSYAFLLLGIQDLSKVYQTIQKLSPLFLAYLLIARVTAEEIFFRGFLVNKIGVIASAVLFGLVHVFYGSMVEVIGAMLLGGILGLAFKKNQNLYPNILAHVSYNLFALFFPW